MHLSSFVRMWGPLWVYSCFGFKNMNGHLKKMFHGTRQILGQLVFTVKTQQSLVLKYKLLHSENRMVLNFQVSTSSSRSNMQSMSLLEEGKESLFLYQCTQ